MQRLDRFLSEAGVASRRELRAIIRAGRVRVNDVPASAPEQKIDETSDRVTLDGEAVGPRGPVVLLLHKPTGYVTSTDDPRDRTVMELLPPQYRGLAPVGRLDKDTSGLLLLTDDGQLAHRLISPRHAVWKIYDAVHEGEAGEADCAAFRAGSRCATERSAARLISARSAPAAALWPCARESTIRCAGCWPAAACRSRRFVELPRADSSLERSQWE